MVVDEGTLLRHFLITEAVDVSVRYHMIYSLEYCVVLVGDDWVEERAVRERIWIVSNLKVVYFRTCSDRDVVVVCVDSFVVVNVLETEDHQLTDVTSRVSGWDVTNALTVDRVKEFELLFELSFPVDAKMLK